MLLMSIIIMSDYVILYNLFFDSASHKDYK